MIKETNQEYESHQEMIEEQQEPHEEQEQDEHLDSRYNPKLSWEEDYLDFSLEVSIDQEDESLPTYHF